MSGSTCVEKTEKGLFFLLLPDADWHKRDRCGVTSGATSGPVLIARHRDFYCHVDFQ